MQWPEALQTNSFSVQLFMGSVAGTEVPEVVVEIVGKFPLKKEPKKCWAPRLRHSSFIMVSPPATPTLFQGGNMPGQLSWAQQELNWSCPQWKALVLSHHSYTLWHLQEFIYTSCLSFKFGLTQWVTSKNWCQDSPSNHRNWFSLWSTANRLFRW